MFFYSEEDEVVQPIVQDPHFSNVSLLLKMDTDFSDSSLNNSSITTNGNISLSTTESKYGGASGYFGGGQYLTLSGASWGIGTGDFTIELWAYFPVLSMYATIIDTNHYTSGILWRTTNTGKLIMWFANTIGAETAEGVISTNVWHHLALTRTNGVVRVFVDGIQVASKTLTQSVNTNLVRIGQSAHTGMEYLYGYLDDLRITTGVSRYTSNFTPPDSLPTS